MTLTYDQVKTFTIKDPDTNQEVEVEMTIGQRLELKRLEEIQAQLMRLNSK